ncbi:MAG: NADP-dependent oxidoreductase [Pseudomonadales bacterium]|nr:NADP-dependent oxidoreductase [Pseudomonadales bacterium]
MTEKNRQFLLAARPVGMVKETDFEYREVPVPEPAEGEVLIRTTYLSLDPSMRGQMENRADYVAPLQIGDVMRAGGVGRIVRSRNPAFPEDAQVSGTFGMQDYVVSDGRNVPFRVVDGALDPTLVLGVLGGTGMTAFFGLLDLGRPQPGETVVVSGAAGATGSVAGQIAKLKGCRVIGIAGSDAKCRWLTGELGFDAAINYRTEDVGAALDRHCPRGIDIYFDNVGGEILDLCLARIANNARVVLCGGISRYNATGPIPGPKNYFNLVFRRARMEGFIVLDYAARFPEAIAEMRRWIDAGQLKQQVTVIEGFRELPRALIRLFEGYNTGKLMVQTT